MSQEKAQTTTIVRQGNTIIIAHPPVKKQTNYWELFTGLFKSQPVIIQTPTEQSVIIIPVEQSIIVEVPVSSQSIQTQPPFQCKQCNNSYSSQEWKQWAKYLSRESIASYHQTLKNKIDSLHDIDNTLSADITKFKEENLLCVGDIRVRSILMAFSSALLYKVISFNTTGFLRRTRNLGVSFIFMGYWFVPELFNPFLRKPSLARNIA